MLEKCLTLYLMVQVSKISGVCFVPDQNVGVSLGKYVFSLTVSISFFLILKTTKRIKTMIQNFKIK